MKTKTRTKLCWNCEGRVSPEEKNCPFCAVYLNHDEEDFNDEENLTPPYRLDEESENQEIPASPYSLEEEIKSFNNKDQNPEISEREQQPMRGDSIKSIMVPMSCLLVGSVFFIFGMILLLFSRNGLFTLQWNGDYWFFYQLFAIPLLYFGWKSLGKVQS